MGHKNAEGMAHVGVRVEPTVRPEDGEAMASVGVRLTAQLGAFLIS